LLLYEFYVFLLVCHVLPHLLKKVNGRKISNFTSFVIFDELEYLPSHLNFGCLVLLQTMASFILTLLLYDLLEVLLWVAEEVNIADVFVCYTQLDELKTVFKGQNILGNCLKI